MAIAIPPPITPQLAQLEQVIGQSRDMWSIDYQGVAIHVVGDLLIDRKEVAEAVSKTGNISDAVRTIGALFYLKGYPATLLTYAVANPQELYVRVVIGKVAAVTGPDALKPFFQNLLEPTPLRASQLERSRALADNFSDRAGENFAPQLRPLGPDTVAFDLGSVSNGNKQLTIAGDFSNNGNRYAGPYLADLLIRQSTESGDEVVVSGTTSVNVFHIGNADSRPYREGDINGSRVTPYGIFGIEGRYASFGQNVQTIRLDGHLSSGAATWLFPVYADFDTRLILQGRIERSDESVAAQSLGGNPNPLALATLLSDLNLLAAPSANTGVLSELYNSVQLDINGVSRFAFGTHSLDISGLLSARKGLSDSSHATGGASLSYFLLRPSLSLRYSIDSHLDAFGDTRFQIGNSAVPQIEQFVIGGPSSLHAYDTGVGVGDHGEDAHLGVEWHGLDGSWAARYSIRPRVFVEYGETKLERSALNETAGRVDITDVGLGIEAKPISAVTATVSVAQSIHSHGDEEGPISDARKYIFFQIAGRF